MTNLERHAVWVLLATFALSFTYELYRATVKAGTSRHDSIRGLIRSLPLYAVAAAVITALFAGLSWAAWAGLAFSVLMILVSILYYNPKVMIDRQPRTVDWFEDLVFTGLLFVAATLLAYDVTGWTLQPGSA